MINVVSRRNGIILVSPAASSSSLLNPVTFLSSIRYFPFESLILTNTQAMMAELFQTTPQNITIHIKAIYEEAELAEEATCKDYLQVRYEGKRQINRELKHYSLEIVLAVGFRVRSNTGT